MNENCYLGLKTQASELENATYQHMVSLFRKTPIPDSEILANMGLYMNRSMFSRLLTMSELYRQIVNVHGVVSEFGVRWGQNLSLFIIMRTLYEPFNFTRRIIGFDTFEGFPSVSPKDGESEGAVSGAYAVQIGYEQHLDQVLTAQEALAPRGHLKRYELVKGDVTITLDEYLTRHPETVFSMIYLDMDIYEPTKHVLEKVIRRIPKGGIIGFDEVCRPEWPGETIALIETLGICNVELCRSPVSGNSCYIKVQ